MTKTKARSGPRHAAACLLLIAVTSSACGDHGPRASLSSIEIPSPAGVGSGEPFLSSSGDRVYMSWLERRGSGPIEMRYSTFDGSGWAEPRVIAAGDRFLVNWADFPSLTAAPDGTLWAHWLERTGEGYAYAYAIRVSHSTDGGQTWSEPWTPHEDGTATEHGFVSTVPVDGGVGFLWLDGRRFVPSPDGSRPTWEMTLRFRTTSTDGRVGPETLVDGRVCDCCQTDAAVTSSGPVAVYRDRSPQEIRDIHITRWTDGGWSDGEVVHEDGWKTAACPVNGPAVAARGETVAVAWFTAAGDEPAVKVAFSGDGGASFGPPTIVDGGTPAGRVDVLLLEDRSALVSWLTRTGGESAEVRVMRIDTEGGLGADVRVSVSSSERASGFPRMARTESGTVLLAWTDVGESESRVRVARVEMEIEAEEE